MITVKIGDKLQDLRHNLSIQEIKKGIRKRAIPLSEVANSIGISTSSLSEYENDKKPITLENAARLAEFYGVSLDVLAGLSDSPIDTEMSVMQQKTGLSKKALEVLCSAPADYCDCISALLESSIYSKKEAATQDGKHTQTG